MSSYGFLTSNINANLPNETDTVAFYAGTDDIKNNFYVTHKGYLFSRYGQIAGWNFTNDKTFYHQYKENNKTITVGMNADPTNENYILWKDSSDHIKGQNWPDSQNHQAKAFFANGDKFYVTHDGYLRSTSGKIASWNIDADKLSNGQVGIGQYSGVYTIKNGKDKNISVSNARIWSNNNFAVDANGNLYSAAGYIGGWSIGQTSLSAENITIDSAGNIRGGSWENNSSTSGWGITSDGDAYFNSGRIGDVTIDKFGLTGSSWHIYNGDILLPGLQVVNYNGTYMVQTSDTGTISGSGASLGGGYSYVDPGTVKSSDASDGSTLEETIKEYIVQALGTTQLTLYESLTPVAGGWKKGSTVIYMDKDGVRFNPAVSFLGGIRVKGSRGSGTSPGISGVLLFSNNATLTFSSGVLINVTIPENTGMNWTNN